MDGKKVIGVVLLVIIITGVIITLVSNNKGKSIQKLPSTEASPIDNQMSQLIAQKAKEASDKKAKEAADQKAKEAADQKAKEASDKKAKEEEILRLKPWVLEKNGQAIMCNKNDVLGGRSNQNVYRYIGDDSVRHYPDSLIAESWDLNWKSPKYFDCKGLKALEPMKIHPLNSLSNDDSVVCKDDAQTYYRKTRDNILRPYPDHHVASTWNPDWNKTKTEIDCNNKDVIKGSPLEKNPLFSLPEGKSVKCNDGSSSIFRKTGHQLRLYPSLDTLYSWVTSGDTPVEIDCKNISRGPDMKTNPLFSLPEGKSVKCNDGSSSIFRKTGHQLRLYPSLDTLYSWVTSGDTPVEIDCKNISRGPDMKTNSVL